MILYCTTRIMYLRRVRSAWKRRFEFEWLNPSAIRYYIMICHKTCHVNRFDKDVAYINSHNKTQYPSIGILLTMNNRWHHEPMKEKRHRSNLIIASAYQKYVYIFLLLHLTSFLHCVICPLYYILISYRKF